MVEVVKSDWILDIISKVELTRFADELDTRERKEARMLLGV